MRIVLYLLILICQLVASPAPGDELRAAFAMDADPEFHFLEPVKFFSAGYKPLWLQALARPEADLQRLAAETIAQAHEFGFPGMGEARPRLLEILTAEKSHPTARFAAARALIVLDCRDVAPALFEASQRHGADLRQMLEPQLGQWKFKPLGEVWRARLTAPEVRHRELQLAIDGVAQLEDKAAVPSLLKIVHDRYASPAARLAAARSAGILQDTGLEDDATKLTSIPNAPILNRLCAVSLFAKHASAASRATLSQWAVDPEPTIAAAALRRMLTLDPDSVLPLADGAMRNADPNVRQLGADALISRPTPERVKNLSRLLDDPHPTVRGKVRDAMYELSKKAELDATVRTASVEILGAESWRGQEQATLLLASLDHKAAAQRLVQLLESPREEVLTTAAWGLRKLAVPETLPAILDKAQRQTAIREAQPVQLPSLDFQVVHLFEALGLMHYMQAEPLLRKYIPKSFIYGNYSRGAAIWALGQLYQDRPDPALVAQLSERMTDIRSVPPETGHVQIMSAIALGRMQAKSEAKTIRDMMAGSRSSSQPNMAFRWALTRLTGEALPELERSKFSKSAWFLTPLDESPETKP
jgi:HEAT repeat protein